MSSKSDLIERVMYEVAEEMLAEKEGFKPTILDYIFPWRMRKKANRVIANLYTQLVNEQVKDHVKV